MVKMIKLTTLQDRIDILEDLTMLLLLPLDQDSSTTNNNFDTLSNLSHEIVQEINDKKKPCKPL